MAFISRKQKNQTPREAGFGRCCGGSVSVDGKLLQLDGQGSANHKVIGATGCVRNVGNKNVVGPRWLCSWKCLSGYRSGPRSGSRHINQAVCTGRTRRTDHTQFCNECRGIDRNGHARIAGTNRQRPDIHSTASKTITIPTNCSKIQIVSAIVTADGAASGRNRTGHGAARLRERGSGVGHAKPCDKHCEGGSFEFHLHLLLRAALVIVQ